MTPRAAGVWRAVVSGASAGLLGGAMMLALLVLDSAGLGMGHEAPPLQIAATFLGPRALVGGAPVVALGVVMHFAVATAWGAIFGLVVRWPLSGGPALSLGLAAAFVILVVMTFVVLPLVDPTMRARVALFWGGWICAHALYGVGLGLTSLLRRRLWPVTRAAVAA